MKFLSALLRLMRWPNLLFVVLTQFLFWYFVLPVAFTQNNSEYESMNLSAEIFWVLVLASVLIAAAGYVINDYFDVDIDQINKSSKVIIGKFINKKSAIVLYTLLSLAGLALSWYVGDKLTNYYILLFNFLSIVFLWLYSAFFKKKLLIGNILVAFLTAWVILVLTLAEYRFNGSSGDPAWQLILKVSFVYGGFAFILSLVREMIKDLEDMEGDTRFGCTTLPIVWGVPAAKVYTGIWLVVLTGLILMMVIYFLQLGFWNVSLYAIVTLILPLGWVMAKLYLAIAPGQYNQLSTAVKLIMLAGILSMLFFYSPA